MSRLDELYKRAGGLQPKRIYMKILLEGKEEKLPIAHIHKMVHEGQISCEKIVLDTECFKEDGNCAADFEAFLHLMAHKAGARNMHEKEHSRLLNDMAKGQKLRWAGDMQ